MFTPSEGQGSRVGLDGGFEAGLAAAANDNVSVLVVDTVVDGAVDTEGDFVKGFANGLAAAVVGISLPPKISLPRLKFGFAGAGTC